MYFTHWHGPEISVATTKAYSTQLIAAYLSWRLQFAKGERGQITQEQCDGLMWQSCMTHSGKDSESIIA